MAKSFGDTTSRLADHWRWLAPSTKAAAVLYAVGLVILIWPVSSKADYGGKFTPTGSDGSEICGVAIAQAFVAPSGEDDDRAERKRDCASKARGRVGTGVLLLLLSIPPAFISLREEKERTRIHESP
jgi:hypothetical protein